MLRLTTRGLGGSAGGMVTSGLGSVAAEVVRIIRGGRSAASRAIRDVADSFKISAMLIQTNGKEIVTPILNSVTRKFLPIEAMVVKARTKKITSSKPKPPVIKVNSVLVRNKNNGRN